MKYEVLYNLMVVFTWSPLHCAIGTPGPGIGSEVLDLNSAFSISSGQVQGLCSLFDKYYSDADLLDCLEGRMKLLKGNSMNLKALQLCQ